MATTAEELLGAVAKRQQQQATPPAAVVPEATPAAAAPPETPASETPPAAAPETPPAIADGNPPATAEGGEVAPTEGENANPQWNKALQKVQQDLAVERKQTEAFRQMLAQQQELMSKLLTREAAQPAPAAAPATTVTPVPPPTDERDEIEGLYKKAEELEEQDPAAASRLSRAAGQLQLKLTRAAYERERQRQQEEERIRTQTADERQKWAALNAQDPETPPEKKVSFRDEAWEQAGKEGFEQGKGREVRMTQLYNERVAAFKATKAASSATPPRTTVARPGTVVPAGTIVAPLSGTRTTPPPAINAARNAVADMISKLRT